MRYSLLSRFQGTLVGAAIGEILADRPPGIPPTEFPLPLGTPQAVVVSFAATAQTLIRYGTLELEDWKNAIAPISTTPPLSTQALIATIPITLFFHEDETKLRQHIYHTVDILSTILETRFIASPGILAVGYAIAQSLKEKLDPAALIPQTIAYLQESQTSLVQQLAEVQTLLANRASLETAVDRLAATAPTDSTPLALAFYCFLSTPEDFRISILRAARTGIEPALTSALTGALSGAHNSIAGIPLAWRVSPTIPNTSRDSGVQNILQLASKLLAAWSGVYDVEKIPQSSQFGAIAAPHLIRPR